MNIEILDDGTIKTTTDKISAPNHSNAEDFLAVMAKLAGGKTKRERRGNHQHVHGTHGHTHEH